MFVLLLLLAVCQESVWNVWSCFWEPRPRPNFKPLQCLRSEKQANFPLIYPKKKLQNEPSCKSLYSTICVTKCAFLWLSVRTFTVGHIFPLFLSFYFRFVVSVLLLQIQVFLLCSALPYNVSDNKLRTNPKGRTLAFFRSEAFRGKMHPEFKSEVLQDESRKALIWAKLRLAGRTALVNDADWRVFYHSLMFPL